MVADALERALEQDLAVEARLLTKYLVEKPLTLALAPILGLGGTESVSVLATLAVQAPQAAPVAYVPSR